MKKLSYLFSITFLIIISSCKEPPQSRVDFLLEEMTIEEKIGQMMQICFSTITLDGTKELDLDLDKIREAIVYKHAGSFISGTGSAERWVDFNAEVQRIALEETRLGIPLLIGIDHIHGANYVDEGTILPHSLTLSCSFDPEFAAEAARITAIESADLGLNWNFAPVLDLGKNVYWPRLYETYGEDPLLCTRMGSAHIKALQGCEDIQPYRMAACAKHFVGYSDPKTGWDRTPAEIPSQILYEYFLPPFRAAVDAGVRTFMLNSGEVNGEPVHISKWLQQEVLRKELGFDGVILSDIKDIMRIVEMHAAAENEKEATFLVIDAGVDISMSCNSYEFLRIVKELIEEGRLTEDRIDASVKRILQLKEDLGLFDNAYPRSDRLERIGSEAHRAQARKIAEGSMVLLKNEGVLPLNPKNTKILLAGFAADSKKMLNGAWTLEWLGAEEDRHAAQMPTLREALEESFGTSQVLCLDQSVLAGKDGMQYFTREASKCNAIVITLGEEPYSEFKGNISDLDFPSDQLKLAQMAIQTGLPVIAILVEGRPLDLSPIEKQLDAILFAGYPGTGGARAITSILSGAVNPSGRLSFTYPATPGHILPYSHKVSDRYHPMFPFGFGLSYTRFAYEGLTVTDSLTNGSSPLQFSVTLSNMGDRAGAETVLLYMRDMVGTITRPVKRLVAFDKIWLEPGEIRQVRFQVLPEQLSYPDRHGDMIAEDGLFEFYCADQSCKVRLDQD